MEAADNGDARVVEVLIAAGADVRGDAGRTGATHSVPMCTRPVAGL